MGNRTALASKHLKFYSEYLSPLQTFRLWFSSSDFPGGSDSKASVYNVGDPGLSPGLGRSPGEGNGNPLQYSCLENAMDRGAWKATVYGVAKSRTRLSDFTFTFTFSSSKLDVTPRLFHLYKGNSTKVTVGIINVKLCYLLLWLLHFLKDFFKLNDGLWTLIIRNSNSW